jgi:hypothetical protein
MLHKYWWNRQKIEHMMASQYYSQIVCKHMINAFISHNKLEAKNMVAIEKAMTVFVGPVGGSQVFKVRQ